MPFWLIALIGYVFGVIGGLTAIWWRGRTEKYDFPVYRNYRDFSLPETDTGLDWHFGIAESCEHGQFLPHLIENRKRMCAPGLRKAFEIKEDDVHSS